MDLPEPAHVLLQHQGFLRALARRLVTPDEAEDLVQETWVRALERPPRESGSLRQWLRTVAGNLAASGRRRSGGRAERERRVARGEAIAGVDEDLAQAELLRSVLDAVLALDEPYRATILARYFRGLSAPEIAAEAGLPLATVRSREQRALARLREDLDRGRGGDRAAWAGLLVGFLAGSEPVPGAEGLVVRAGVAAGVLAIAGIVVWQSVGQDETERPVSLATAEGPAEAPALAAEVSAATTPPEQRREAASSAASLAPPVGTAALAAGEPCEVRGRFVLPGGAPAIGLEVLVTGWVCQPHRAVEVDPPEDWVDPNTTTDADGRFTLSFVPSSALCYQLETAWAGYAPEEWTWLSLAPGEVQDVGVVELRPGGTVEGRVRLPDGQPVAVEGLEVHADGQVFPGSGGALGHRFAWQYRPVEAGTGRYRIEDLPPGPVRLDLGNRYGKLGPWTEPVLATIVAGQVTTVDLTWAPPAESRDIVVEVETSTFDPAVPALESVHLKEPGEAPRVPDSGEFGRYVFGDPPEGPFTLEIDDPRFGFWQRRDVAPGDVVEVTLEGSATIWLDVRDEDGNPVESFRVDSTWRDSPSWPNRFLLHDGKTALAGGRLGGIVPGDHTLTVQVPGHGARTVEVAGLQPGESRTVTVALEGSATLAGHVRDTQGAPVPGALVLLLQPATREDGPASPVLRRAWATSSPERYRREIARTFADAQGAFHFEIPRPGDHALLASVGPVLETATVRRTVGSGEELTLDVVLPRPASLLGTIHTEPPVALENVHVEVVPEGKRVRIGTDRVSAVPGTSGDFQVEGLPPGDARVWLMLSEYAPVLEGEGQRLTGRLLGTVPLTEGEPLHADFDVAEHLPGRLRVQVLGAGGMLEGALVRLHQEPFPVDRCLTGPTDANGVVELRAFPGEYRIAVVDAGGTLRSEWLPVSVEPGGQAQHTLVVDR